MEKPSYLTWKLVAALSAYLALALIATLALDGWFRAVLYGFFALLAWKTVMAARADAEEEK